MTGQDPIFPIPAILPHSLNRLRVAKLVGFYERNVDVFTALVVVCYAWFLSEEKEREQGSPPPQGETLFKLFCILVEKTLTAPDSTVKANMGKHNRLADAFFYNHIRAEGIGSFRDYFGSDGKKSNIEVLISDFVRFIVLKGFKNGAAAQASCPTVVMRARGLIHNINRGDPSVRLKPV
jgi:hypothetical protein